MAAPKKTTKKTPKPVAVELTSTEIINKMAETSEYAKKAIQDICGEFIDAVRNELLAGNSVSIYKFGKFMVKERAARKGRNPITGESINVAAKQALRFKPSVTMKNGLNV